MNLLVIGDIIGKPGRRAARMMIERLKKERSIDWVIANGENLAHGSGMTNATYEEMRKGGVDFFTTGNHIFTKPDIFPEMEKRSPRIIRPANFPPGNPGKGWHILSKGGTKILVINLHGRVFMHHNYDCPFRTVDQILDDHKKTKLDGIVVDFHAEATSEKIAMKHYLDGRVSALWGTHTHIPTADARLTSKGMAYITDIGMTGPDDSVIGTKKENVIDSFLKQTRFKLEVAEGRCVFSAIVLKITGCQKAQSIEFIQEMID